MGWPDLALSHQSLLDISRQEIVNDFWNWLKPILWYFHLKVILRFYQRGEGILFSVVFTPSPPSHQGAGTNKYTRKWCFSLWKHNKIDNFFTPNKGYAKGPRRCWAAAKSTGAFALGINTFLPNPTTSLEWNCIMTMGSGKISSIYTLITILCIRGSDEQYSSPYSLWLE